MSESTPTPEARFARLVEVLLDEPGVTPPGSQGKRSFGSDALKVHDKIFAMLSGGWLVVKLPRQRVDELVAAGKGERFDPRRDGRVMKEWLSLDPAAGLDWLALAREALAFVGKQTT